MFVHIWMYSVINLRKKFYVTFSVCATRMRNTHYLLPSFATLYAMKFD